MGEIDDSVNVYQYDGNYKSGFYFDSNGTSMSNIFTSDSAELLEAVSFWTRGAEIPYKISVYTNIPEGGDPTSGTLVHTQQGEMLYAGYHKIDLSDSIYLSKGCRYSIVVDLMKEKSLAIHDSYSPSTGISYYAAYNITNGQRYSWNDVGNSYNYCLKAFSSQAPVEADGVIINAVNFPDAKFRQYVADNFDKDKSGKLSQAELGAVTEIYVSGTKETPNTITSLKGVEYFTKLENLYCNHNQLTNLDVSKNIALTELFFDFNQITNIDVSKNTALERLHCVSNNMTTLDISKNTSLEELLCFFNQITSLDVSNNTYLVGLYCYNNRLTSLDVSKNTYLGALSCYNNQLTSLGVSKNTILEYFDCHNNKLTTLDVTKNTELNTLHCCTNQLTSLDLSRNTKLTEFTSNDNTYYIGNVAGSYSLSKLPIGFNRAKASNWTGAIYDVATNSLTNFTSTTVTYTYDCGNGRTVEFALVYTPVEISSVTVTANAVIVTYSDSSSERYSFDEVTEEIVDYMIKTNINLCIDFVNAFSETEEDSLMLTGAQMKAIEAVLEYDYGNA